MLSRLALAVALAFLLASCGSDAADNGRTVVVAGFYPLAWAAEQVGGESVTVRNLTPPGAEPHDVELSARAVDRIRDADVVLLLGGHFQPALERAAEGARGTVLDLLDELDLRGSADGGEETADPHVWLDPARFAAIVERVGTALGRPEPAARLAGRLRALDVEYRRGLVECERRELVTAHAAFGYLADRYGLQQISISGISPEAEPSARRLEQVAQQVREHRATTVFVEPLVSARVAETVARETGTTTATLNPIEGLTEDELAAGDDYLSLMRANLETLRRGLGCR